MTELPTILVDFNEMVAPGVVLLSRDDERRDIAGSVVTLAEGMKVRVVEEDIGDDGVPLWLAAEGVAELNVADDWSRGVRWCCRFAPDGPKHYLRSASARSGCF
jgi:hypothetical protein